jgi:hypothetical protein
MLLAKYDDVIEALAPDRADEPVRERVLPWTVRCCEDLGDPDSLETVPERAAVDRVAVAEQVGRGRVVRKSVDDLLRCPRGSRGLGHVEVDDTPAIVSEHNEDEDHSQARGGDGEEVERDEVPDMVGEKCPPTLGWGSAPLQDQPRDGAFGDIVREYFNFLRTAPPEYKGVLGEQRVRVYGEMAVNSGTYTFSTVRDSKPVTIPARFSFVYRNRNGRWMIVDHHSSAMPAPPQ